MNNIEISKMTFEDVEFFKNTLTENFDNFWSYGILKSEFDNINSRYIVAKIDNDIVGFAGILIIDDSSDIMNIVTRKDKRNLGIASTMLASLIDIAKLENLKQITLEVNENNIPAINLYKKFNFSNIGIRKNYYNHCDNAIIMSLNLKD